MLNGAKTRAIVLLSGGMDSCVCAAMAVRDFETALSGPLSVCRDDWVAYCYHPRGARGETMLQCLQTNQANVSPGCQKALEGAGGTRQKQPRNAMP